MAKLKVTDKIIEKLLQYRTLLGKLKYIYFGGLDYGG